MDALGRTKTSFTRHTEPRRSARTPPCLVLLLDQHVHGRPRLHLSMLSDHRLAWVRRNAFRPAVPPLNVNFFRFTTSVRGRWNENTSMAMAHLRARFCGCRRGQNALDWCPGNDHELLRCSHARLEGKEGFGRRQARRIIAVRCAADTVATADEAGAVCANGSNLRDAGVPIGALSAAEVSGDPWIAFADAQGVVELWCRRPGASWKQAWKWEGGASTCATCLATWQIDSGHVAFAAGCVDGRVRIHVVQQDGSVERCELEAPKGWVRDVDGSGARIACGGDQSVVVWKMEEEGQERTGRVAKAAEQAAPPPRLKLGSTMYRIRKEAVLHGHQDWVTSVRWMTSKKEYQKQMKDGVLNGSKEVVGPCLVTASMDRTISIWRPDQRGGGLWMNVESMGEAGESRGVGFFTAIPSADGHTICANGYTGAIHTWRREPVANGQERWGPVPGITGHFDGVVDLCWGRTGDCPWILTVSADQTARVFARLGSGDYKEIARPQVHGHNLQCVACVKRDGFPLVYVSGAEEKVLRVFGETKAFRGTIRNLCNAKVVDDGGVDSTALGASVPALGLSNKAVFHDNELTGEVSAEGYPDGPDFATAFQPTVLESPPLEEQLQQNTLWPELQKLYGHGNDLFCMDASHKGDILASACKAQSPMTAAIWLWDTEHWRAIGELKSHTLTVTQLAFSPDDRYLLSVSRDRSFSVFVRKDSDERNPSYELLDKVKGHNRIIWTGAWAPHSNMFATGSRDQSVKVWQLLAGEGRVSDSPVGTLPAFDHAVTALAWAPLEDRNLLSVGLENGDIELWSIDVAPAAWSCQKLWKANDTEAHCAAVKRLSWEFTEGKLLLASCGLDHAVSIFEV